jgi:hypothetical protein
MISLLLGLLRMSLAPAAFVALVVVGQTIALLLWDRMFVHEERRADRVTGPSPPEPLASIDVDPHPPNVVPLAEWRRGRTTS